MKKTPLYNEHLALKAKMVGFHGWDMPLQYTGIIEEHLHTRNMVSVFDICHMGEFLIKGPNAAEDINHLFTSAVDSLKIGQCRYGFLLNEKGRILDDLITYRLDQNEFMLVVNAETKVNDAAWIKGHLSKGTFLEDISDRTAKIDLQGPHSQEVLSSLIDLPLDGLKYFGFKSGKMRGIKSIISRTGYTGELGFELYFDIGSAVNIWETILNIKIVKPAGLGSRDTLRLEMGYPLYGQDINLEYTPVESGHMHLISMDKDFIGKPAIEKQVSKGAHQNLVGFILEGRQAVRPGYDIFCDNKKIGIVTSGSFCPSLKCAIGLGYVKPGFKNTGTELNFVSGRRQLSGQVAGLPFYKKGTVRRES